MKHMRKGNTTAQWIKQFQFLHENYGVIALALSGLMAGWLTDKVVYLKLHMYWIRYLTFYCIQERLSVTIAVLE